LVDEAILRSIQAYLRVLENDGLPVRFGVLFGSQVKGKANKFSDIDLLVVSPKYDLRRSLEDMADLFELTATTDYRIEPIPCGERQWEEDDESAIIEIARREGIRIDPVH